MFEIELTADTAEIELTSQSSGVVYWGTICGNLSAQTDLMAVLNAKANITYVDEQLATKANIATTLAGYGITDAKIEGGVITLGSNTITPITSHQDISGKADTTYVNTQLATKQNTLTAGSNVQINNNVISATDTTYTAGTGISIVDNVISNTQTSAEWGNITGTLSAQTDLMTALNGKQATLIAGQNITIVDNVISATGGGGSVTTDGKTINTNASSQIQTIGVLNQADTTKGMKEWVGTYADYVGLSSKDNDTLYFTIEDLADLLNEFYGYPLNCVYCLAGNAINWKLYGNSVQSILPAGYTQLEYIESSGTQYIDTGVTLSCATDDVEIDFQPTNSSGQQNIFGARDTTSSKVYTFSISGSYLWRVGWHSSTVETTSADTDRHTLKVNHTDGKFLLDGTLLSTRGSSNIVTPTTATLFAIHATSGSAFYYGSVKIYSYKLWRNDRLSQHFIPAKRNSDNAIGMYDTVSGIFFTNRGTGTFTAGAVAPSPSTPLEVNGVGGGGGGSVLPSGYQEVEYIESSGGTDANTPYINTNYKPNYETKLSAKVIITQSAKIAGDMGTGNAQITLTINKTANYNARFGTNNISYDNRLLVDDGEHTITMSKDGSYIDDTLDCSFPTQTTWASNTNLYLFKFNGATTANQSFKMKWFKIWDNDVLVREFIPCKNSSNVIGMYDTITNTFFTNSGTGSFTAGAEVYRTTIPIQVNDTTQHTLHPSAPLHKVGTYADYIDYENQRIVRRVGVTTLSEGTHTIANAVANSPYLCTQQTGGTLSGQSITLDTGVTNATVYFGLATETYESFTVPAITMARGTNVVTTDTEVQPSDGYLQCKVSEV